VRSCFIDGEAIVVDENGLSVFELLRYRRHDHAAVLCAFDLIELNGNDLRRTTIEQRKAALAKLLLRQTGSPSISTTAARAHSSTSIDHWLKIKNPVAPAVRRVRRRKTGTEEAGNAKSNVHRSVRRIMTNVLAQVINSDDPTVPPRSSRTRLASRATTSSTIASPKPGRLIASGVPAS
jgi:hypothetical protein